MISSVILVLNNNNFVAQRHNMEQMKFSIFCQYIFINCGFDTYKNALKLTRVQPSYFN